MLALYRMSLQKNIQMICWFCPKSCIHWLCIRMVRLGVGVGVVVVILSSLHVKEPKGGRLVVKQNPEVLSIATMYTSLKQVNPPSHPGQPSGLISTNTLFPSLVGNHPKRKCWYVFHVFIYSLFPCGTSIGLANNGHVMMLTEWVKE